MAMIRIPKRRWMLRAALALLISVIFWAWWRLPAGPFFDDGPFRGSPTTPIQGRQADQSMPIFNGLTLEVFDPQMQGVSPVVQLRQRDGVIRWAIHADGHQPGDVRSLRFEACRRGLMRSGVVRGTVHWTYGHENMTWFITGGGHLRDYWYSW